MPRVVQTLNSPDLEHPFLLNPSSTSNVGSSKMPDSSAGDSPRQQPAKPVRPALPSNRGIVSRTLNFGSNDKVLENDINENSENLEVRPKKIELNSRNFLKPQSSNSSPRAGKFTPKPGGLAEAAAEVNGSNTPLKRSTKWQKSTATSSNKAIIAVNSILDEWKGKQQEDEPQCADNLISPKSFYSSTDSPSPVRKVSSHITYGSKNSLSGGKSKLASRKELEDKINKTRKHVLKDNHITDDFRFSCSEEISKAEKNDIVEVEDSPKKNDVKEASIPQKLSPHKIGFQNRGNTCYLNASLQALLGLPMVVADATNIKFAVAKLSPKVDTSRLVLPFASLCHAQSNGEVQRANRRVQDLKYDMESVDSQFAGNKMQDANEFLCRFLDELKGNIENLYGELGDKTRLTLDDDSGTTHTLTNLVETNFLYEREEEFTCCSCGKKSQSRHTDVSFFCDISQSTLSCVSLQKLLHQTFAPEVREKRCESCHCETATTTTKLVKLPKVLVIYLKRYKYSQACPAPSRKITRLVDVPDTVNLSCLTSENVNLPCNTLPVSLIKAQSINQPSLSTPTKKSLPVPLFGTPIKFKGKTEEELLKLSEEEQTEYLLYISQKEAVTSQGRENVFGNEEEDDDLKAALEASLMDVPESDVYSSNHIDDDKHDSFKTPFRKRHHSITSSSSEGQPSKISKYEEVSPGTNATSRSEGEIVPVKRGDTPIPCVKNAISPQTFKTSENVLDTDINENKAKSWKNSFHRPETKAEEEADMLRALELSTQDMGCSSDQEDVRDNSNNTVEESVMNTEESNAVQDIDPGFPEHNYKLSSVVSHFGASASAGHYVADVFRFDVGGWFRYDDTVVTQTDQLSVRTGSNRSNGYIFMYVHQPLWELCDSSTS